MTDVEEPTPTPDATAQSHTRSKWMRGCGCLAGLCVLGLGILIIGNFDETAWASSLIAIVIGFLTFSLSGVNGMWDDK
jgi:hypothetical protein